MGKPDLPQGIGLRRFLEPNSVLQECATWTAGPKQEFDPDHLDIPAVNEELALLLPATPCSGNTSLAQGIAIRIALGLRSEFRSCLAAASLDASAVVDQGVAEAMTAHTSVSAAASDPTGTHGILAVLWMSLCVMGSPCSGGSSAPEAVS